MVQSLYKHLSLFHRVDLVSAELSISIKGMDDLSYYDSQLQYQQRVGEIEKERLKLEREMFTMMKSDKRLHNFRAAKLRSYWQHVCERERKARERNENLMKDFEQVEMRLAAMDVKTKKLRRMKAEYYEKVKEMYPKWRQEVEIARAKKQLQDKKVEIESKQTKENLEPYSTHTSPRSMNSQPDRFSPRLSKSENISSKSGMSSPSKAPNTSTPKSAKNSDASVTDSNIEAITVQPPPASFADANIQKDLKNSSAKSPNATVSVIHSIPTASLLQEADESDSESSFQSDNIVMQAAANAESSQASQSAPKNSQTDSDRPIATAISNQNSQSSPLKKPSSPALSPSASLNKSKSVIKPSSPVHRSDSKLSMDSFNSSEISPVPSMASPRSQDISNKPLTDNTAYKKLLLEHGETKPDSLKDSAEEDSEDDLENLLSPHGTQRLQSKADEEDQSESTETQSLKEPVYIPSAISTRTSTFPSKLKNQTKAPWDTDSEEEYDYGENNMSNTGGSSKLEQRLKKYDPEDDFDFYD